MRKSAFALALLAALSMTLAPISPSFAASPAQANEQQRVMKSGNVAVLSHEQMNVLAVSNPALHAKVQAAYDAGKVPKLSKAERRHLVSLTAENMDAMKAGNPAWVAIIIALAPVLILPLFGMLLCSINPQAGWCGTIKIVPAGA
jgi:hypothetical protein